MVYIFLIVVHLTKPGVRSATAVCLYEDKICVEVHKSMIDELFFLVNPNFAVCYLLS